MVEELLSTRRRDIGDLSRQYYPLFIASMNGHLEVVRQLLLWDGDGGKGDKGACCHVDTVESSGATDAQTPLVIASWAGHADVVRLLLRHGADRRKADRNGVTALFMAAQEGHCETARALLEESSSDLGAAGEGEGEGEEEKGGAAAARSGPPSILGRIVDLADDDGVAPLHKAAAAGGGTTVELVRLLLEHGANAEAVDVDGETPLFRAAQAGAAAAAALLLEHGVDVDRATRSTTTCDQEEEEEEDDDDDGETTAGNTTPLSIAAQGGHADVVELLLRFGADGSSEDDSGATPLAHAEQNGHSEIAALLLSAVAAAPAPATAAKSFS